MRAVKGNLGHSPKERWRKDAERENTHVGPVLPERAPSERVEGEKASTVSVLAEAPR